MHEQFNDTSIAFVAGSYQVLQVNILDALGNINPNLQVSDVIWRMAKYGEWEVYKTIQMTQGGSISYEGGIVTIELESADTQNCYGLYTHQCTVVDGAGESFIIDMGQIAIKPRIH